jgi:hypothetical protein
MVRALWLLMSFLLVSTVFSSTSVTVKVQGIKNDNSFGLLSGVHVRTDNPPTDLDTTKLNGTCSFSINLPCTLSLSKDGYKLFKLKVSVGATYNLTILKYQTITWNHDDLQNKIYGDQVTLSASASSGLPVVFSSSFPDVANLSGSTVNMVGVGVARIVATTNNNPERYVSAYDTVVFNVAKKSLTLTGVHVANKVYDGSLSANVSSGTLYGILGSDDVGFTTSASFADANAGLNKVVTIDVSLTGTKAGNYSIGSVTSSANISKANATVTIGDLTATYDGTVKGVSATTSPAGLTVNLSYVSSPVGAGSYPVTATISDANYNGSAIDTLKIGKALATVALSDLTQTYNGSPKSVTVSTSPIGLSVTVTYDGSTTVPSASGTYLVMATVNDANYIGSSTVAFVIAKVPSIVTLGGLNVVYDGSPKTATVTTVPEGISVAITYNGSSTAPVNAGTYSVVALASAPYAGRDSSTMTIAKASQAIAFESSPLSKRVGDTVNMLATAPAGVVSLISSDTSVAKISGFKVTLVGVGSVTITASQMGNGNYEGASTVSRTLTSVGKPILVTSDSVSVKGGSNVAYKAGYSVPGNYTSSVKILTPSWLTVQNDSVYGKAPNANKNDTVQIIISVDAFSDTLEIIVHIKASTGTLTASSEKDCFGIYSLKDGVKFGANAGACHLSIYNMLGKLVYEKKVMATRSFIQVIPMSSFNAYIVKLVQENRSTIKKIQLVR